MCEIRGYRELVGHGAEERQACLLAEQTHAPDRGLGAVEQEWLLGQRGDAFELDGVGILFPAQAESGELAFGLGVNARGDLAEVLTSGGEEGKKY